ncbi:efflux RND transporter periplasmic adaptor subunit [Brevibacillus porteri]|uniref:Efflux RND transporter periplasmic adaptor subunit n=1 Tax=Brevibacillus porteri TaxID=2126350 RepID=A0ABX5FN04_9BACL|nr:efflux RND transporter periplasmic adaptor subunit [Brevibacillus porteri]MED1799874.1 efflux RND transporter periplasmic adaptor subunit [Brevibacillus porteri]MED2132898.1 efflux RND transporter periplasmic adaptor subunit [Brevibacillus porteri]MED2744189.1 efflux RND transporter periplasmic adaptor subunit [Brevibacillus porteri]MED2816771.1 efflux RND transporter periplasmic adaptor subunit [Brevibacillus porteri]MED2894345.1 efflux RND transporter periplasmic adaptor subunit [Brevibac
MKKRLWIWLGVGVLVAGFGGYAASSGEKKNGVPVTLSTVITADLESTILTSGMVMVRNEHTLFANYAGDLRNFSIKEGDKVTKGQVIGNIDMSDVSNEIMDIEAQITIQEANIARLSKGVEPEEVTKMQEQLAQNEREYQTALKDYQRTQSLFTAGVSTQQAVEQAKQKLQTAESSVKVAKQDLLLKQKGPDKSEIRSYEAQIQKLNLEKAKYEKQRVQSSIVSPIDGTVLSMKVKKGKYLSKGEEILTVGDTNDVMVEAGVGESDLRKIKIGQDAVVSGISLGGEQLQGKVSRISPMAVTSKERDGESTRVPVAVNLNETREYLKPGFHVDVNIVLQKAANAMQVPVEAVVTDQDGSSFVWVAENGKARKKKVTTGIESELFIQIESGLDGSEELIANPPETLRENEVVFQASPEEFAG